MKNHVVTFPTFVFEGRFKTQQDYTEEMKKSLMKKSGKKLSKVSKMQKLDK
jgi:hypothetical protein